MERFQVVGDCEENKTQAQRFIDAAAAVGADESPDALDRIMGKLDLKKKPDAKMCPECGHIFKGNGWDGIDAHWRSKHEAVMPYEEAWPLLKSGNYPA